MEIFVAQLICGINLGFVYAIVVIGYNLLFLVTGMIHWAHSHLLVISMAIAWLVLEATNDNIILGISAAILSGILIGILVGPVFIPLIKRFAALEGFVCSLAIATIAIEVMSHWVNYGIDITFPLAFTGAWFKITHGVYNINLGNMITLVGSIIILVAFFYFLNRTKQGRILRVVAQDSDVAVTLGISVPKTAIFSFALAGFMAGVTAIFMAMCLGMASPGLGDKLAIKCLAILLFASTGNLKGGLICALILGVVESLTVGYLPGQWTNAVAFAMIVGVLLFKPQGLFGQQY